MNVPGNKPIGDNSVTSPKINHTVPAPNLHNDNISAHEGTIDQQNGRINGEADMVLEEDAKGVQLVCFINVNGTAMDVWLGFCAIEDCLYNGKEANGSCRETSC